ncbi:hypothetical protein ACR9E3_09360 [Actinomycetospora sp. C-140]
MELLHDRPSHPRESARERFRAVQGQWLAVRAYMADTAGMVAETFEGIDAGRRAMAALPGQDRAHHLDVAVRAGRFARYERDVQERLRAEASPPSEHPTAVGVGDGTRRDARAAGR